MKLTFFPDPATPYRVIDADDPQPEESWSPQATNKRIAPPNAPTTQADAPPAGDPATAVFPAAPPAPFATAPASDSSPAGTDAPDFLKPLPPGSCPHCPDRPLLYEARQQAHFYRAMFGAAKQREATKDTRIAELEAENRILKQRLYGTKSESRHGADQPKTPPQDALAEDVAAAAFASPAAVAAKPQRKRGQQKGNPIPQRRDYSHLPVRSEEHVLPDEEARCPCCGLPFAPGGYEEDSEIIEIEVNAYRRRIRRRRYLRRCSCPDVPAVIAAPVVPRLMPHSPFGVSVWVQILLDKYNYARAMHKQLDDLHGHGLGLASGTVIGGLKRLAPLLTPVYDKLAEHSRQQKIWGADETRWPVFQVVAGKVGHCWYLWLVESADCAVFILDKGRAHDVPEDHFGEKTHGIVVVDRYSAYKAMKHVKEGRLRLAFCWAHQRRDFLEVEKSWPKLSAWAVGWLEQIGALYKRNGERLQEETTSQAFKQKDEKLRQAVEEMRTSREAQLQEQGLHPTKRKVLQSMKEHWEGLTLFVDNPHVPMDNNASERTLRIAALCRKNFYGSGCEWSGKLAASMFSIMATLKKHRLNPRKWLTAYLQACAEAGGKAPQDVDQWLPWNLSAQQKQAMAYQEDEQGEASDGPEEVGEVEQESG
jgi:transposase